ncbi:MAG: NCS2 family permease [Phycisphaerales bacterium]|nr:NCS2 family permease [Phycisphaerales bacterium]
MLTRPSIALDSAARSSTKIEVQGGIAIFLAIAYIMVIEPAVLSGRALGMDTGMPEGAAFTATCIAASIACILMGVVGRLPIAAAPYMGENFFFVTALVPAAAAAGYAEPWRAALATTLLAALMLFAISITGLRRLLAEAIPSTLVAAIGGGIGLFIAFLGLKAAGAIVANPSTFVGFTPTPLSPDLLVATIGLVATIALHARGSKSAVVVGIVLTFALGLLTRELMPYLPDCIAHSHAVTSSVTMTTLTMSSAIIAMPPSPAPLFLGLEWSAMFDPNLFVGAVVLLFMILFDATGTLLAVTDSISTRAKSDSSDAVRAELDPRFQRGLMADALGSLAAPLVGTSSVGAYMESAVAAPMGARRGLAAIVVGICFLLALPFAPVFQSFGSFAPATAPALIFVGALLVCSVKRIPWDDITESVPALVVIAGVPLTFSIAHGIAFGFLLWPVMKLAAGRGREVGWVAWGLGVTAAISLCLH